MEGLGFRLNPALDPEQLAGLFATNRRLHIPDFLVREDAQHLHESLRDDGSWKAVVRHGEKRYEFDPATFTKAQREQLDLMVWQANPKGIHYCFGAIGVPDSDRERASNPTSLNRLARFLCSEPILSVVRTICAMPDISFADAQGTAYGAGDFLGVHDDDLKGKGRRAAYVLNLSPSWHVDWGGLLLFPRDDGHVAEAFTPRFNALNLFAVPQTHSVSMVVPFAGERRYAVSGWFRSGDPPE